MQINFEPYLDPIFRFALSLTADRHLAEDLTQECFLRAHQRQGQLQSQAAAKSWLFQILLNLWKDQLKRKRVPVIDSVTDDFVGDTDRPGDASVLQEDRQVILQIMQSLPERQRTILFLSAVQEWSNAEIAVLLGSNENAVKANLSIARKTMRQKIPRQPISRP